MSAPVADVIHTARTAQQHAVRALAVRGPAHPIVRALLAAAATAAVAAWEAGHHVTDTHALTGADQEEPRAAHR
jgi:tRNA A37 threonylcarbamoyladenosine synthetase subunit TsaC/SUA5/YrdC